MVAKSSNAPASVAFTKTPPICCGTSTKSAAAADTDGRQGGERIRRASFPDASFRFERHQARNLLQAVSSACTTALALTAPVRDAEAYAERETAPRYRQTDHIKVIYRSNGYEVPRAA
jgi:hypothetical protein